MQQDAPSVVVAIVVNWNRIDLTRQCLKSLLESDYPVRVVVVDNASVDGSATLIKNEFPQVLLVESPTNLGFAEGNNLGLKSALSLSPDYVLLLNNDAVIERCTLTHLIKPFRADSELGITVPKIYFADDETRIWALGGEVDTNTGQGRLIGSGIVDVGQFQQSTLIDYPIGCAMMIRRDVLMQVGLFWNQYFAYYEDTEFGVRVRDAGFKIRLAPKARVWHKVMSSLGKTSPYATYLLSRNRLFFVRRNSNNFKWYRHGLIIFVWYFRQLVRFLIKRRSYRQFIATLLGLYDFLVGNTGVSRQSYFVKKDPL